MWKYLLVVMLPVVFFSCKSKTVSLAVNDERVNISDFLDAFQTLGLPYQVTDSMFKKKDPETAVINYNLFIRLVPDTVLTRLFGNNQHPRLFGVGKVSVPHEETYLFVKSIAKDRRALFILCFDKRNRFAAARPILFSGNDPNISGQAELDNKYTLTLINQRKTADGQMIYHKDAYVYNDGNGLTLILTETNEATTKVSPVYNPIDTLARKHRFSGDYAQDKRNLISIRDGRDASRFLFFIHFEKEAGTCKGELKGEARFTAPGVARYRSYSDPCAIEFSFGQEGITMKELGGCGVHRDIKCFFEGYFERRHPGRGPGHKTGG